MIRERARVLEELRADLAWHQQKAAKREETVRLFKGQLRAQEERRKEIQGEIEELERQRESDLREFKKEVARREERERDEDQIQRFNRGDG